MCSRSAWLRKLLGLTDVWSADLLLPCLVCCSFPSTIWRCVFFPCPWSRSAFTNCPASTASSYCYICMTCSGTVAAYGRQHRPQDREVHIGRMQILTSPCFSCVAVSSLQQLLLLPEPLLVSSSSGAGRYYISGSSLTATAGSAGRAAAGVFQPVAQFLASCLSFIRPIGSGYGPYSTPCQFLSAQLVICRTRPAVNPAAGCQHSFNIISCQHNPNTEQPALARVRVRTV